MADILAIYFRLVIAFDPLNINQLVIEIYTIYINYQCSKLLFQLIELYFLDFVSGDVDVFPRMY
jgi:hypothetical protein